MSATTVDARRELVSARQVPIGVVGGGAGYGLVWWVLGAVAALARRRSQRIGSRVRANSPVMVMVPVMVTAPTTRRRGARKVADVSTGGAAVPVFCLDEVEIMRDLDQREMASIAARAPMRTVERGGLVWSPADGREVLYIVKRGRVRLLRSAPDGRTLTLAVTRETTTKVLGDLQTRGVVTLRRGKVVVLDLDALRRLSEASL